MNISLRGRGLGRVGTLVLFSTIGHLVNLMHLKKYQRLI